MQGSIIKIKAMKSAKKGSMNAQGFIDYITEKDYYKSDYYVAKEEEKNGINSTQWSGKAESELGLSGVVTKEALERTINGFDSNGNRIGANQSNRQTLAFDITNSVPKSVSIAIAFAEPELQQKMLEAICKANEASMKVYEDNLSVRTGHNGTEKQAVKGLAIASVLHCSSRELDTQFHMHNAVMSYALKEDGTFATIDHKDLCDLRKVSGAYFGAVLAHEIEKLGIRTELDKDNDFTFRIKGIKKEEEKEFSRGRQNIAKELEKMGLGIDSASKSLISKVAKQVRKGKEEPDFKDLVDIWKIRGRRFGLNENRISGLVEESQKKEFQADTKEVLRDATKQTTEYTQRELAYIVATKAATTGGASFDELNASVDSIQKSSDVFALGHLHKTGNFGVISTEAIYTSKERIKEDFEILRMYKEGEKDQSFIRTDKLVEQSIQDYQQKKSQEKNTDVKMTQEQLNALRHCTQSGRITLLEGFAGTGKSFTVGAVAEAERLAGQTVLGTSLQKTVATDLVAGAGLAENDVYTTAQLLINVESGKLKPDSKTTLIVDEAAMISNHEAYRILKAFENSKIIFLGDPAQYEAIGQGGYFAGLIKEGAEVAQLKDITRQKDERDRQAVLDFKNGESLKALDDYESRGRLHIADSEDAAIKQTADAYLKDKNELFNKEMTASTHDAVNKLNKHARTGLIEEGKLSGFEYKIEVVDRNNKEQVIPVQVGERLRFTKNEKKRFNASNGEKGTVTEIERSGAGAILTIKKDNGETVKVDTNTYKNLWHGYARTGHISQGKTDNVNFNYIDRRFQTTNAAYVMNSRARFENHIFTSRVGNESKEQTKKMLAGSMQRTDQKKWAVSFFNEQQREELARSGVISMSEYKEFLQKMGKKLDAKTGLVKKTKKALSIGKMIISSLKKMQRKNLEKSGIKVAQKKKGISRSIVARSL